MLLFTDRYYRSCARLVGRTPWPGPASTVRLIFLSACHAIMKGWSARATRRITDNLLRHAESGVQ